MTPRGERTGVLEKGTTCFVFVVYQLLVFRLGRLFSIICLHMGIALAEHLLCSSVWDTFCVWHHRSLIVFI